MKEEIGQTIHSINMINSIFNIISNIYTGAGYRKNREKTSLNTPAHYWYLQKMFLLWLPQILNTIMGIISKIKLRLGVSELVGL